MFIQSKFTIVLSMMNYCLLKDICEGFEAFETFRVLDAGPYESPTVFFTYTYQKISTSAPRAFRTVFALVVNAKVL